MVAGNHHRHDTGARAVGNRRGGLVARRIEQAGESKKIQILLNISGLNRRRCIETTARKRQHRRPSAPCARDCQQRVAVKRPRTFGTVLTVTEGQDLFRRALYVRTSVSFLASGRCRSSCIGVPHRTAVPQPAVVVRAARWPRNRHRVPPQTAPLRRLANRRAGVVKMGVVVECHGRKQLGQQRIVRHGQRRRAAYAPVTDSSSTRIRLCVSVPVLSEQI